MLVHGDRHAHGLPQGEPPGRVLNQDEYRQVAGLDIGKAADKVDLPFQSGVSARRLAGRLRTRLDDPELSLLPDVDRLSRARGKVDGDEDLPGIDHLTDRGADRDCLAGMTGKAVEHTVDRRANRVQVEMSLGERDRSVGHGDLGLGLRHRLRPRPDQHGMKLGFRGLLQDLRRGHRQFRLENLLLGNLTLRPQGPEPFQSGLRSSRRGSDLRSASEALRPSRVAVFSARSARTTDWSSSTIGWPFLTVSPCLTTSSWTCPSTAGVSIASLAGIASLRPRPSTVWMIVPRLAASTRTVTWASSSPECPSFASAVRLSLWQPASPTQSSPTIIQQRPVMPLLPRSQYSVKKSRRTVSPDNISGGKGGQYGQAS